MNKGLINSIIFLIAGLFGNYITTFCQPVIPGTTAFTRADTLRGSITPQRIWWDVLRYDITIQPDYNTKTITGSNIITYKVVQDNYKPSLQIDLQQPLIIDSILADGKIAAFIQDGNAYFVNTTAAARLSIHTIAIYYHGKPIEAVNAPWDGGWIWSEDLAGRPWMTVACQGLGASAWYPCKDHQSDEPDSGATISIIVPDTLVGVGNGRLIATISNKNHTTTYKWEVKNPINNYNIVPYIGKYDHYSEIFKGEKGALDCSYWVLDYNMDKAKKQFTQAPLMLRCFEYWFGAYPFYEDGYKLVEAPHLGMEHQSAVAYGNQFANGYMGRDLSRTGWGLKWDFIIVHESGHEWFGNNITSKDVADMWIHESFTNYSETLFTECQYGKTAANEYLIGIRCNIENDRPIIGPYNVNKRGSDDMYYKGGNMIHAIRQVINNDTTFRAILRGLNSTFYHQTVTSNQIEQYINKQSGIDFTPVFNQYLRTTKIPVLEYKINKNTLSYRWTNCIDGFNMPVKISVGEKAMQWLRPTQVWKTMKIGMNISGIQVDPNFYIFSQRVF